MKDHYKSKYERDLEMLESAGSEEYENEDGCGQEHVDEEVVETEEEKTKKKKKQAKQRMRSGIDKSQLARETRCGLKFTGEYSYS